MRKLIEQAGTKNGQKYRFFKRLEKKLLNKADQIITLTTNSKRILVETHGIASSKIEVIRTCADEKLLLNSQTVPKKLNSVILEH